jgi:RNA polymerase sigma factor (sigma-70 family)
MKALLGGDAAALNRLIRRYDRLVRFTVFRVSKSRSLADPHWVDTIAADTWTGFVRSIQRDTDRIPASLKTYLIQTARNRCISAIRSTRLAPASLDEAADEVSALAAGAADPGAEMGRLEELEALRSCVDSLSEEQRRLYAHCDAITERRWVEVARTLGEAESTVRSRWKKVLESLHDCVRSKLG